MWYVTCGIYRFRPAILYIIEKHMIYTGLVILWETAKCLAFHRHSPSYDNMILVKNGEYATKAKAHATFAS